MCSFLIFAANLLSSRWLGSLGWILIVQGPKQILLPRRRSVINIVIWSHSPCSTALYTVPGLRSVCRQRWHVCLWVKVRWRGWQILVPTWILYLFIYLCIYVFICLFIYLFIFIFLDFIYLFRRDTHTQREAETQAEGEAGSMQGAWCRTQSRHSRIMPWAEGRS